MFFISMHTKDPPIESLGLDLTVVRRDSEVQQVQMTILNLFYGWSRGPGWLIGCTLLSHNVQSSGSNSREVNVFFIQDSHLSEFRIMAVTTERKDGSG